MRRVMTSWQAIACLLIAGWLAMSVWSFGNRYEAPMVQKLALLAFLGGAGIGLWRSGIVARRGTWRAFPALVGVALFLTVGWQAATGLWHLRNSTIVAPAVVTASVARTDRLWIDTDPACGSGRTRDVDDCWAIALALRGDVGTLVGISTVSGNTSEALGREVLDGLLVRADAPRAPVYRGATAGERGLTDASEALIAALEEGPLTVLALGPLTNIAAVIEARPDLASRMQSVVAVAGRAPGDLFHPGRQRWMHFRDFNICLDTPAAEIVLASGVPLTLVPFELSIAFRIGEGDLERLAVSGGLGAWLAERSADWAGFWQDTLGRDGFSPFDLLAVAYLMEPEAFECRLSQARMGYDPFLMPFGIGRDLEVAETLEGVPVTWCSSASPEVKERALAVLAAS